MTLGEQAVAAAAVPTEVRASRRRAVVRRMQRMPSVQRERELVDLGWRDLGGEA